MKSRRIEEYAVMAMIAVFCFMGLNQNVMATALSAARDTPQYEPGNKLVVTMASNVIIYAGSLVCVDYYGKANPAADTAGYAVIGRANATVDNRTAVYVSTKTIEVGKGIFRWENADSIADSNINSIVYVTDDQTVNKTGGGQNIIAGTVFDVDSSGVWVDTAKIGAIGAATPSSLAVTAGATVGTTLTVTGATALNGGITMDTSKFSVTDTSGNTYINGTLVANGATTLSNTLTVASTATFSTNVTIGGVPTLTIPLTMGSTVLHWPTNAPAVLSTNAPQWFAFKYGTNQIAILGYQY